MRPRSRCTCRCHRYPVGVVRHVMACCTIDTEPYQEAECLLDGPHEGHKWWYTSWGGGHMLAYGTVTENDFRTEKNLTLNYCPGKE